MLTIELGGVRGDLHPKIIPDPVRDIEYICQQASAAAALPPLCAATTLYPPCLLALSRVSLVYKTR